MRCQCCNKNLNDFESTLRSASTGEYLDMCRKCLKDLDILIIQNNRNPEEQAPDQEHFWDMDEVEFNPFNVEDEE